MGAATRNRCLVLGSEHICHQPGRQSICDLRVCVWFVPRPSPVPSFHPTSQVPNPIMLICCKFFCSHHTGDIAPTASCSQRRTQVPAAWTCSNRCASTDPLLPGQSLEWEITKGHCEWKHAKEAGHQAARPLSLCRFGYHILAKENETLTVGDLDSPPWQVLPFPLARYACAVARCPRLELKGACRDTR